MPVSDIVEGKVSSAHVVHQVNGVILLATAFTCSPCLCWQTQIVSWLDLCIAILYLHIFVDELH